MDMNALLTLALFSTVTSITPGPNNLMLMASGANFGFRRTVPHMLGIGLGFTAMLGIVGAGLAGIFEAWPVSYDIMRVASITYLLWLAWKIATASSPGKPDGTAHPMSFVQAAAFQWVNPKAWAMALTATTTYMPEQSATAIILVACVFGAINLPCVSSWTLMGQQLARFLTNQRRRMTFNIVMAVLLVVSMIPVLLP